jgi:hypothetical protein
MSMDIQAKLIELGQLNFDGRGESFVESNFLTPLLACLGYEQHRDYEVIRHGDKGSSFKLRYPSVEQGGRRVRKFNPDFIPTIRKKAFWIIEAKSPKDVEYPFQGAFLVQGLQYCLHPEIQARYLLVSNGVNSALFVAFGALNLEQDLYSPILEFTTKELSEKWGLIFDLLSAEKLRATIEDDLKLMYDKLCLSSLDTGYPKQLIRKLGSEQFQHTDAISKHVQALEMERNKIYFDRLAAQKAGLTASQAYALMEKPLGWMGTEGVIFVDRSLSEGNSVTDIFDKLTNDYDKQSIFRKLQSFAGICALFKKANTSASPEISEFIERHKSGELPLLNQVECAWIRVTRKVFIVSVFPEIRKKIEAALQRAPEMIRFVTPPSGIHGVISTELLIHARNFQRISALSEEELNVELANALQMEKDLVQPLAEAEKGSALYEDSVFDWFRSYGIHGKHFAFQNIYISSLLTLKV